MTNPIERALERADVIVTENAKLEAMSRPEPSDPVCTFVDNGTPCGTKRSEHRYLGGPHNFTTDPDGWALCYSDHKQDISTKGDCDMCGSTVPDEVGPILPQMERFTGRDCVQAAKMVTETQSAKFFDGMLLDHFSASAIMAVYNGLGSDELRDKLRAMPLVKAADTCFRVINKVNSRG